MSRGAATTPTLEDLTTALSSLFHGRADKLLTATAIQALDHKYALSGKMAQEPGIEDIIKQLFGRIWHAYGTLATLRGKRILDIACGSSTSKSPSFVFVDTPFGERRFPIPSSGGYTAQFEPWFCRIVLEFGAHPVGVDLGDLESETFEHYKVDLGVVGALDFLPDHSFDAVQDSRLFGSPEFTAQFPQRVDRLRIAEEMKRQERRLLKADGIIIHSDAAGL